MSATANRTDTTYTFGVITPEELDRLSEATSQGSFQQWSGQVRLAKIRGHEAECVGVCDASGNLVTGCVILYLNGRFGADGSVYFGPIGISDDPALLRAITEAICESARRHHAFSVACWPNVAYRLYSSDGQPDGEPNDALLAGFADAGWTHGGFHTGYDVVCQWMYVKDLTGITNGIDVNTFNPETDPALPAHYNADTFVEGKAKVKAALQKEVGLPVKPNVPLMVMVTRLAGHKGLDLLCYIARRLMWEQDAQMVILGTGEPQYEAFFKDLQAQFPDRVAAKITFNLGLAARMYAGADIYLMPSKSEPCGLSQMNAMRYGTVPVVHATGGLKDTVPPCDENGEGGLGFTFQSYNADDFFAAIVRALDLYNDHPEKFRALQHTDMIQDFSWDVPAGKYMELFEKMLSW